MAHETTKKQAGGALPAALAGFVLITVLAGCGPGAAVPAQAPAGERVTASTPAARVSAAGGAGEVKGTLVLTPCQIGRPDTAEPMAAKCATLSVYEDREARQGKEINLRIAVIPAISRSPAGDPLFFITGGPGEAATEDYPLLADAFKRINEKREIVLVDQRGTGASNPLLCPNVTLPEENAPVTAVSEAVASCMKKLNGDTRFYSTVQAVGDLDDVRAALGYAKINLYGVSYGTRVAQSYLARYPDRVRSIILDGVVPQDSVLGLSISSDAQAALDKIWLRCAADAACRTAYPDVRTEFAALLERVSKEPAQLTILHPRTGEPTQVKFGQAQLALAVRLFSYQTETVALLPMLIHRAAKTGDLGPLAAQSLIVANQVEGGINLVMHNSVICAEDAPFYTGPAAAAAAEAEKQGYLGETYKQLQRICADWPVSALPADFKKAVVSDVPALLLSGELDPVTPPANGERVAAGLHNSLHVVAPGMGHGALPRGCTWRVASAFIEKGSVDGLDTGCIKQIEPAPFFMGNSGAP
jgi:pimeloyl-ACP methyl ester carboxylesterase